MDALDAGECLDEIIERQIELAVQQLIGRQAIALRRRHQRLPVGAVTRPLTRALTVTAVRTPEADERDALFRQRVHLVHRTDFVIDADQDADGEPIGDAARRRRSRLFFVVVPTAVIRNGAVGVAVVVVLFIVGGWKRTVGNGRQDGGIGQ